MTRRRLIAALASFLLFVAAIEVGLRLTDPLGALRYFGDLRAVMATYRTDVQRYAMRPGAYTFSDWQATILPDSTRRVPDTAPAGCTIALVGDSVTFGLGVSDADTWANVVARELRGVHIVNTGVAAASIWSVTASMEAVRADGYVYLIIDNDDAPEIPPQALVVREGWAIQTYVYVLQEWKPAAYKPDPVARAQIAEVAGRRNVQAVAFTGNQLARDMPGVAFIPPYTKRISWTDAHADAEGNREIAKLILPIVREFAARVCG